MWRPAQPLLPALPAKEKSPDADRQLTLVAGLGLVVSLIGLVLASFTANRELGERAKAGIAVSVFSIALLYIGVAAANYASHLFS